MVHALCRSVLLAPCENREQENKCPPMNARALALSRSADVQHRAAGFAEPLQYTTHGKVVMLFVDLESRGAASRTAAQSRGSAKSRLVSQEAVSRCGR